MSPRMNCIAWLLVLVAVVAVFSVNVADETSGDTPTGGDVVSTKIDGVSLEYTCRRIMPRQEVEYFEEDTVRHDTPSNLAISLYTQMKNLEWDNFKSLWRNFDKDYEDLGAKPPSKDSYIAQWKDLMTQVFYITHIVRYKEFTIVIVESSDKKNEEVKQRHVLTTRKVDNDYFLTRELSLEEDVLEQALRNMDFDPGSGTWSSAAEE